mgnify:CR=1 FL=1
MTIKGYDFENLNENELQKIQKLESEISNKKQKDVILLAFRKNTES